MKNAVLVTTKHRGVFFGDLKEDNGKESCVLNQARNCIYWSSDIGGFLGLASTGPSKECLIGSLVHELKIYDITSVTRCTDKAVEAWEKA